MPQSQGTRFTAEPLTFIVRHQLWDANVEDHRTKGVSIDVAADVDGKQTGAAALQLLRHREKLVYGPENPDLATPGRVAAASGRALPASTRSPMAIPSAGPSASWAKNSEDARPGGYKAIAEAADLAA